MNDIPSRRSALLPSAAPMSHVEAGPPPPPDAPAWRKLPVSPAKIAIAAMLVGTSAYGMLSQPLTIATEHAVVSAMTVPLRTPIGGEVTRMALRPGEQAADGTAIAAVENARADRRRLLDAMAERDRAEDEAASLAAQIAALDDLAGNLAQRAGAYREETARLLSGGVEEGLRPLAAEAERDAALQDGGAPLRAQEDALARGFVLTGGLGGVGYLDQRLDEVAMRRTDLARQLAAQQSALARARARVAEEADRVETERAATFAAPPGTLAWRVLAAPGQRVQPEEMLAELVDCRAAFILAAVPQRDVPLIQPGQPARVLMDGEVVDRRGTVRGILPDGMAAEGGRLAALPSRPRGSGQLVQVEIAPPAPGTPCPVGRTGRVLFDSPTRGV